MSKNEKLFLKMRNVNGEEAEETCVHYAKSLKGYIKYMLFKFEQVAVFISFILTIVGVYLVRNEELMSKIIAYTLSSCFGLTYFITIFVGIWFWKFSKHVFVTDEGIWIAHYSSFWWRGAPDFMGRRRFLAPSWSVYTWSELKSVSLKKEEIDKSARDITYYFEKFNDWIVKSSKYKTIYLTRFDGVQSIDFLLNDQADEIIRFAETKKKKRRKKSNNVKNNEVNEEENFE